jgi:hypothetical protein
MFTTAKRKRTNSNTGGPLRKKQTLFNVNEQAQIKRILNKEARAKILKNAKIQRLRRQATIRRQFNTDFANKRNQIRMLQRISKTKDSLETVKRKNERKRILSIERKRILSIERKRILSIERKRRLSIEREAKRVTIELDRIIAERKRMLSIERKAKKAATELDRRISAERKRYQKAAESAKRKKAAEKKAENAWAQAGIDMLNANKRRKTADKAKKNAAAAKKATAARKAAEVTNARANMSAGTPREYIQSISKTINVKLPVFTATVLKGNNISVFEYKMLFGLTKKMTSNDLVSHFRKVSRKFHPDKTRNLKRVHREMAKKIFQSIGTAKSKFRVLTSF